MSRHIYQTTNSDGDNVTVEMGYDRPLKFVFCTVKDAQGELLYSNLSDPQAGTSQQYVAYYAGVLEKLGIEVPDSLFDAVEYDQLNEIGNKVVVHPVQE